MGNRVSVYQDTSREALEDFRPHVDGVDARICKYLIRNGVATCYEIEQALTMKHQTVSAQIRHMVEDNVIEDSGERHTLPSNRTAIGWQLRRGG